MEEMNLRHDLSENVDEHQEESDEHCHPARHDLWRDEERGPGGDHEHGRGQVVDHDVAELVPEMQIRDSSTESAALNG